MSVEDRIFLFDVQEELISRCMDDRGFKYVPNKVDLDVAPMARSWDDIRLHPLQSLEQAEREGYGGPSRFVRKTEGHTDDSDSAEGVSPFYDPNREHYLQLSEAEQAAWHVALIGTGNEIAEVESDQLERRIADGSASPGDVVGLWMNTDGCVGVAEAAIYGDLGEFMRLSFVAGEALRNEVWVRIEASPALVDAEAAWQECMRRHGHDFADIWEDTQSAVQQIYDTAPPDVAMARESAIALQDAGCAEETGLFDVIDSELARIADEVMAEHEAEILGYQEMMAKAVETAKDLLAEG